MSRYRNLHGLLIAALTNFLLIVGEAHAAPLKKGDIVPHTALKAVLGESFDIESLKGRFLYIDFWASWCPPCSLSLPFMNDLYDEFTTKQLSILAVSVDDDDAAMTGAIRRIQPKYTVVRDKEKSFIETIDPPKMPTSYLLNPNGEIVYIHEGFTSGDESVVKDKLREILQGEIK